MANYRLEYGETEQALIEDETPYTRMPALIPAGKGWRIPLTLERQDEDGEWEYIDHDEVTGRTQTEFESDWPYAKAEKRILARNHLTHADLIGTIQPW